MKLKNSLVAALLILTVSGLLPWIYLSQTYGLNNIPHYEITMWIFMELYALIFVVLFALVVVVFGSSEEEPEKPRKKRSSNGSKRRSSNGSNSKQPGKKPRKRKKKPKDGSYSDEDLHLPGDSVEYPKIWDMEEFE